MISYAVQNIVAKILAKEDITVRHVKDIHTPNFNLTSRVLSIPLWDFSDDIYIMFIAHEVSHALHTNFHDWDKEIKHFGNSHVATYSGYVNIIEDIRIDRKIKLIYQGLPRFYYQAWADLVEMDFFRFEKLNFDTRNAKIIDKINIYYKCINAFDVDNDEPYELALTKIEKQIIDSLEHIITWDQVVTVSRLLYQNELDKQEKEQKEKKQKEGGDEEDEGDEKCDMPSGSGDNNDSDENSDEESDSSDSDDDSDSDEDDNKDGVGKQSEDDGGEDENEDDLEKEFDDLLDELNNEQENDDEGKGEEDKNNEDEDKFDQGKESSNSETDEESDQKKENSNDRDQKDDRSQSIEAETYRMFMNSFGDYVNKTNNVNPHYLNYENPKITDYKNLVVDTNYILREAGSILTDRSHIEKFLSDEKRNINYMVSRFESKKRASELKREEVNKTGVIDTNNLHTYKYNDDIFLRNTSIKDGKNYGFLFFVDYSESMGNVIDSVIKKMLYFSLFCVRINVPFEMYMFTTNIQPNSNFDLSKFENNTTSLIKIFSSDMSKKDIYTVAEFYLSGSYEQVDDLCLSMTGLNSCICYADMIIEKFMKKYNTEILNTIFITDGQSNSTETSVDDSYLISKKYKTQMPYSETSKISTNTMALLKLLKMNNPSIRLKGYFLMLYGIDFPHSNEHLSLPSDMKSHGERFGYDDFVVVNSKAFKNIDKKYFFNDFVDSIV